MRAASRRRVAYELARDSDERCDAIMAAGALQLLVAQLLEGPNRSQPANVLNALACGSNARSDAIIAAGALQPLAAMRTGQDDDDRDAATELLRTLLL